MTAKSARDTHSLSKVVLHEVAERKGIAPEELNQPLFDVVDPDALNTIFQGDTGHISFEYHGYVVTINHSGNVDLELTDAD